MAKIGVMLLGHRRPWLFDLICEQVTKTWPDAAIQITLDRPDIVTISEAQAASEKYGAVAMACPIPALDATERFDEVRQWQWGRMQREQPDYAVLWDDDQLLEHPGQVAQELKDVRPDLLYITKVQFWDDMLHVNRKLPPHRSPFFFRCLDGDAYPVGKGRIIHAPMGVHDDPTATKIDSYSGLLDVGYLHRLERERVFAKYARVGKIDACTRPLVEPPELGLWAGVGGYWHRRLSEVMTKYDRT